MTTVRIPILDFIEMFEDSLSTVEISGIVTPEEKPTKDCPGGPLEVEVTRVVFECHPDLIIKLQDLILKKYEQDREDEAYDRAEAIVEERRRL
jgi:hypothetical protein